MTLEKSRHLCALRMRLQPPQISWHLYQIICILWQKTKALCLVSYLLGKMQFWFGALHAAENKNVESVQVSRETAEQRESSVKNEKEVVAFAEHNCVLKKIEQMTS